MPTSHPTLAVMAKLHNLSKEGSESAQQLIELIIVCTNVLETFNGFEMVFGILGDSPEEICAQHVDDALADLFPVVLHLCAGGWESLKWYAPPDMPFPYDTPPAKKKRKEQDTMANITLWNRTVQVELHTVFEREGEVFGSVTITMPVALHEQVTRRDETNEEEESYLLPHVRIIQTGKKPALFYLEGIHESEAVYEARFTYTAGTHLSLMRGDTHLFSWNTGNVPA